MLRVGRSFDPVPLTANAFCRAVAALRAHAAASRATALSFAAARAASTSSKVWPGPVEHGRLAGVALPPVHRDVHVFRVKLNGAGATASLLRRDDGGAGPAEWV